MMEEETEFGAFGISQLVAAFEILGDEKLGLSLKAANALLVLCGLTMFPRQPRLPNVTDISNALGMTASGTSRVMSNLVSSGFVQCDREIRGPKSGAFFLTDKGKALMTKVLLEGELFDAEDIRLRLHNVESYARSKFIEKTQDQQATFAGRDEAENRLYIQPIDKDLKQKMTDWWGGDWAILLKFENIGRKICVKFSNRAQMIHFMFRWVGHNRQRNGDENI